MKISINMYWSGLRWSKRLNKYFNLLMPYNSDACTLLHSGEQGSWSKISSNNTSETQKLFMNTSSLRLSSRYISTSCVMQKGREKGEKKKSGKAIHIDLNEVREVIDVNKFSTRMENAVEDLKNNFIKYVALRSSTGSIEQIRVEFEGDTYILQELVHVMHKPKMIVLQATPFPQAIPQILKAISNSGMNLNPQQDGTTLYIPIPKVTKEHRENLAKNAKSLYIKTRDNIKDIKNKEVKDLKKKPSLPEDKMRRIQAQLEALCEEYVKKAEGLLDTKQKELLKASD